MYPEINRQIEEEGTGCPLYLQSDNENPVQANFHGQVSII